MNMKPHIAVIDQQIAKLQHAKTVLLGLYSTPARGKPGRPKGSGKPKRKLSAEARAKIAAAQKKRWAASKKMVVK
jgi:hypothetical protein